RLRGLVESAARVVVHILGFDAPTEVEFRDNAALATLRAEGGAVGLLVTHWGERLDPLWRVAVIDARRRAAAWCVLFNGTHIRLLNAARLFSRRFTEFDLDGIADDETTAAATRMVLSAEVLTPRRSPRQPAPV